MRYLFRFTVSAGILLTVVAWTASAPGQQAVEFPPVSNNAALQYWQAFAMLPALDAQQNKLLEDWAKVPLDAATDTLLDQSRVSLMFLHRGGKLKRCDWGLDYRDGISLYLPHLAKSRTLARLAALDARRAFGNGHRDRARDDAFGMMALARQVGSDHTLISMLVSYSIEEMTVEAVAPHLPELDVSYDAAVAMFQSLPPRPGLEHGVRCEKRLATSIIQQLKQAEQRQPGSWRSVWNSMLTEDSSEPIKDIETLPEVVEMMDDLMGVYDELGELARLPVADFDARYPEFVQRSHAANPAAKLLLPSIEKVVSVQRRSQARVAMLLAATAVVEGGPEKLIDLKDPFGDGPFGYRKLDSGFELSSKLVVDGKSITLGVGQQ